MFANRLRKVGQVTFTANLPKGLDMPRKDLYREILIRINGRLNISTLGSPVTRANAPFTIIKRIELIADGRDTIKSISGQALAKKNQFFFSGLPKQVIPSWGTGNMDYSGILILPLAMPRAIREIDTLLDSGKLSTLELRVTYGTGTDLFSTAPTTFTDTYCNVDVHLLEGVNVQGQPITLSTYKEMTIEKEVTQTQSEFQMLLPVGNVYRGFLIEAVDTLEPNDTIINKMLVRSGTTVFYSGDWLTLKEYCFTKMGVDNTSRLVPVGYAYIDLCPEGRLVDALDTSQLSMLEIIFDVTKGGGQEFIRVYPDEVIIPAIRAR